jgi:DNA-binding transcriptional LysR family regulator
VALRYDPVSLRLFVAVAQTGSISAAAARIPLALAAASRRIVQLETDAGVPLLERQPRGVMLTAAGEALLRHAREVEDAYERMRSDMAQYGCGVRGTVRVAANSSSVLQFLPDDLRRFVLAHPDLRIDLKELPSEAVLNAVLDGTAEVGVCDMRGLDPQHGLQVAPYAQDELALLVPASHALARRRAIAFADALDSPFVIGLPGTALRSQIVGAAQRAGRPLLIGMQVRGFEAMVRMVSAGLGVAVLPRDAITMRRQHPLRAIRLTDEWAQRQHCVVHRPLAHLSLPARLFASLLAEAHPDC